jgi:hypothetical protein
MTARRRTTLNDLDFVPYLVLVFVIIHVIANLIVWLLGTMK